MSILQEKKRGVLNRDEIASVLEHMGSVWWRQVATHARVPLSRPANLNGVSAAATGAGRDAFAFKPLAKKAKQLDELAGARGRVKQLDFIWAGFFFFQLCEKVSGAAS